MNGRIFVRKKPFSVFPQQRDNNVREMPQTASAPRTGTSAKIIRSDPNWNINRMAYLESVVRRESAYSRKIERKCAKRIRRKLIDVRQDEVEVKKKRLPLSFIALAVVAVVLLSGVVFSFASVASSTADLYAKKEELKNIEEETSKMSLLLDQKNDEADIENVASDELLMVREDLVQKKYINVDSGDRIVLENDTETEGESKGFFTGMLSTFSEAFDDIIDYFR